MTWRPWTACLVGLTLCLSAPATAAQGGDGTGIEALSDLDQFQQSIDTVLVRTVPATVAISVGGTRGTGVIVSPDGLVLTAAHVIGRSGRRARVTLADGRRLSARTLGSNVFRDGGMLQIQDAEDLPYVDVPAPHELDLGDWCIALGHPRGYEEGRPPVPRLGRLLSRRGRFVQTDCPLTSGDSGGPLFDLKGRLIGIHSRIETDVEGNFHVPLSSFRLGWKRLHDGEVWSRGDTLIGVKGLFDDRYGAAIGELLLGMPAEGAGLKEGDVIQSINGERVRSADELRWFLAEFKPGDEVALELLGFQEEVALVLAPRREEPDEEAPDDEKEGEVPQ